MCRQSVSLPPTADPSSASQLRGEPCGEGTVPWSAWMHQQLREKWGSGVTRVNHGLVEDTSYPEYSTSPNWFNPAAPPWIRDKMGKRLIGIDCCSAPRLAFWLTFTWHQPQHLEVLKSDCQASSSERHQGTSRRQFILQGRWKHLPTASPPTEAAWGRHVCRQGAASCPSSHRGTACLQLLQWEISTHYHKLRGENKHSSLRQLLISSSYSCEDRDSTYKGAAQCDTCASLVISDTMAQRTVKPQLSALLSAPVPAPAPEHHPVQPWEMIPPALVMLSPIFYIQVTRQKLS